MKTLKHIQSLLVIIIACITLGSCSNELDVTKLFSFNVEIMPIPKELSQGETIEIRYTLTCLPDYSGTQYTIRYFQYDGDGILRMGKDGEPFIPNDRYPLEKGNFRLYYTFQSTEQQSLEIVFEDNMGHSQVVELDLMIYRTKNKIISILQ